MKALPKPKRKRRLTREEKLELIEQQIANGELHVRTLSDDELAKLPRRPVTRDDQALVATRARAGFGGGGYG